MSALFSGRPTLTTRISKFYIVRLAWGIWIGFYSAPVDPHIHATLCTISRKRRFRPRSVGNDPHHVPLLSTPKVRNGAVGDAPLVPNYYSPLLPPHAATEVETLNVSVQELEQSIRLLVQEALDAARDRRIHKKAGLAGHCVLDDERVGCGGCLPGGSFRARARDLAHGRRGVQKAQTVQGAAENGREGGVNSRQRGGGCVAAA